MESLPSLVFTAGFMVKKSASDASISSGTHGQYSILQMAKLLPGAPQQAVSSPFSDQSETGQLLKPMRSAPWSMHSPSHHAGSPLSSEYIDFCL